MKYALIAGSIALIQGVATSVGSMVAAGLTGDPLAALGLSVAFIMNSWLFFRALGPTKDRTNDLLDWIEILRTPLEFSSLLSTILFLPYLFDPFIPSMNYASMMPSIGLNLIDIFQLPFSVALNIILSIAMGAIIMACEDFTGKDGKALNIVKKMMKIYAYISMGIGVFGLLLFLGLSGAISIEQSE